jgi:CHASE3 domain sensor protein
MSPQRVEVRQEPNGKFSGYVLSGNDEYPAAPEMDTYEEARKEATQWATWMEHTT